MKRTLTHSLSLAQHESPCSFKCSEMKGLMGGNKGVTREAFLFFSFFPKTAASFGSRWFPNGCRSAAAAAALISCTFCSLAGPHSEFTSGRCFHIERGARPQWGRSQHIGNRHILLTASGEERQDWPLLNTRRWGLR